MTKEDIICMARESGAFADHMTWVERDLQSVFERFAALVAEEVRGRTIESEKAGWLYAFDKVIEVEREACAKVADRQNGDDKEDPESCVWSKAARRIASDIRARGEK